MLVIGLKLDKEKSLKLTCEEELCSEYKNKHVIFLLLYCEAENILWSPGIWLTFYCSWHSGVVFLLSGLETILYHSLYLEQQFLKRGWWILFDLTVQCTYRVPFTERFHMHLLHMTHMSFKCIHPLYISRGFSGQWVNRFVLSCLAMALIGGPFPNIVLHPPEQFILQIIVNLEKSDFSSVSPPAELTIVQLHHRSAAWVSSELAALQILCYLALVLSPGPFPELRVQPLISGKRTGSAPRSEEGAREKALVKLPCPKIEGPAPQFWEKAPPLKNGQFRGQKHLEQAPNFFHSFITYTKFTFCKKFGPNRPIQTSAVVRIFYCRLYGVPTTN